MTKPKFQIDDVLIIAGKHVELEDVCEDKHATAIQVKVVGAHYADGGWCYYLVGQYGYREEWSFAAEADLLADIIKF